MELEKHYFINDQEVDVSVYTLNLAKDVPGEYAIRCTEKLDSDRLARAIDEVHADCMGRIAMERDMVRDEMKDKFRYIADVVSELARATHNEDLSNILRGRF